MVHASWYITTGSPTNLTGHLGTHTNPAIVEEVVAVRDRDTVTRVTVSARLEAVEASLITTSKEKLVRNKVKQWGKDRHPSSHHTIKCEFTGLFHGRIRIQ